MVIRPSEPLPAKEQEVAVFGRPELRKFLALESPTIVACFYLTKAIERRF